MSHSIEDIARSLAFGSSALSRDGLVRYIDDQMTTLLRHKDAGRNPRMQKEWRYWKAGIRALELHDYIAEIDDPRSSTTS